MEEEREFNRSDYTGETSNLKAGDCSAAIDLQSSPLSLKKPRATCVGAVPMSKLRSDMRHHPWPNIAQMVSIKRETEDDFISNTGGGERERTNFEQE